MVVREDDRHRLLLVKVLRGLENAREVLLAEKISWNEALFARATPREDKRTYQRAAKQNAEQIARVNGLLAGFRSVEKCFTQRGIQTEHEPEALSALMESLMRVEAQVRNLHDLATALLSEQEGETVARFLAPFVANAGLQGELVATHEPG